MSPTSPRVFNQSQTQMDKYTLLWQRVKQTECQYQPLILQEFHLWHKKWQFSQQHQWVTQKYQLLLSLSSHIFLADVLLKSRLHWNVLIWPDTLRGGMLIDEIRRLPLESVDKLRIDRACEMIVSYVMLMRL